MTHSTPLLLGVHAHQPVGNFPHVIDDAVLRCYHPFLETMHRFPDFPFAIHISGWLLSYLVDRHPRTITLLQEMVGAGGYLRVFVRSVWKIFCVRYPFPPKRIILNDIVRNWSDPLIRPGFFSVTFTTVVKIMFNFLTPMIVANFGWIFSQKGTSHGR